MNSIDLLSLQQLKNALGITAVVDDSKLAGIITGISSDVLRITGRAGFSSQNFSEVRDGTGTAEMMFKSFPVTAVSSVMIDTTAIQFSTDGVTPGYVFDQYALKLVGLPYIGFGTRSGLWSGPWIFRAGKQNVSFSYTAGYPLTQVAQELYTVPASGSPITITPNVTGPNFANVSVQYFSGGTLTNVGNAQPPSAGNYGFNPNTSQYYFAAGDAGRQIQITYNYGGVPYELTQYLMEWAAIRYMSWKRIGLKSQGSKTGENSVFDNSMPDHILAAIQRYRSQAPVNS